MSEKTPKNNDNKYLPDLAAAAAMAAAQPSATLQAAIAAANPSAAMTAAMAAAQPSATLQAAIAAANPSAAMTAAMAAAQPSQGILATIATANSSAALTVGMTAAQPLAGNMATIAAANASAALSIGMATAQVPVSTTTAGIRGMLSKDAATISDWMAHQKAVKNALGTNLNLQKILDEQNELQKLINQSGLISRHTEIEALRASLTIPIFSPLTQIHNEYNEIGRIARERSAIFGTLKNSVGIIAESYSSVASSQATIASFRLPRLDELFKVHVEQERWSKIPNIGKSLLHLEDSIAAISTPWIRIETPATSISAFAALQGVGAAVREIRSFDPNVLEVLRQNLGDWSSLPKWPRRLMTDPLLRTDFYVEHGFKPALTDFPEAAFDAGLDSAGLGNDDLGLLDFEPVFLDPDDADALATRRRAKACFEILYIFEEKLRAFIDREMTSKFGANWMSSRLPGDMNQSWREKRAKGASPSGQLGTLIDFADFTDYEKIICKKDNWREVFGIFFARVELITMAFYFLRPIRLAIMHSRKPTYNDELFLRAEVTKLSMFL